MVNRALLAGALVFFAALAASVVPALAAPMLSIETPAAGEVTNNARPTFSGVTTDTASGDEVTVNVLSEGSVVQTVEATPDGDGHWSVRLASDLDDGEYTAVAKQTETLTGDPGASPGVSFRVLTAKPAVTLNAVSSPTNDTTPSFSGTASETTDVTVLVFEAGHVGDTPVAEAHAFGTGGSWSSDAAKPALADGTYTAVAVQESAIGNGPGVSQERTFTVHAAKPVVTLSAVSSPTTDSTPSFSGTASEKTSITVRVFAQGDVDGTVLAEAHASGTGGSWSSGGASPALADGTYTAGARQER